MIALIPARSGSKRVPDKNIRELGGMPLIAYTIIAAKLLPQITAVWVSTDNFRYAEIARKFDAHVLIRPPELATDQTTDLPVIKNFIKSTPAPFDQDICFLRPTTPFRKLWHIEEAIKLWNQSREEVDSLRSIEELSETAYKCFTLKAGLLCGLFDPAPDATNLPNQQYHKTYKGNGYIDIVKSENILNGVMYGARCIAYETPQTLEIDTMKDWEMAEAMVAYNDALRPGVIWGQRRKEKNEND